LIPATDGSGRAVRLFEPIQHITKQERENPMTKSELIDRLADVQQHLAHLDVELGVKSILEQMSSSLSGGERIEIRGFGSFSLHYRAPRMGRNPKTGEAVALPGKHVPHFKPGKALRERVNNIS
jgi:integration host factor subunit beta